MATTNTMSSPTALSPAKPTGQLISRRQLAVRWGCCVESIKRRQRAGLLQPVYLSARMVRYSLQNIEQVEGAAGWEQEHELAPQTLRNPLPLVRSGKSSHQAHSR